MYVLPFCLYNACSYIEIDVFLFYHRASLFVHSNLGSALGVVWTCNQWLRSNSQVSFKSYTFLFANRNITDSIVWLERLIWEEDKKLGHQEGKSGVYASVYAAAVYTVCTQPKRAKSFTSPLVLVHHLPPAQVTSVKNRYLNKLCSNLCVHTWKWKFAHRRLFQTLNMNW